MNGAETAAGLAPWLRQRMSYFTELARSDPEPCLADLEREIKTAASMIRLIESLAKLQSASPPAAAAAEDQEDLDDGAWRHSLARKLEAWMRKEQRQ